MKQRQPIIAHTRTHTTITNKIILPSPRPAGHRRKWRRGCDGQDTSTSFFQVCPVKAPNFPPTAYSPKGKLWGEFYFLRYCCFGSVASPSRLAGRKGSSSHPSARPNRGREDNPFAGRPHKMASRLPGCPAAGQQDRHRRRETRAHKEIVCCTTFWHQKTTWSGF